MAARKLKTSKKSKVHRSTPKGAIITVRAQGPNGMIEVHVTDGKPMEQLSREWGYILRSRSRWAGNGGLRYSFRDRVIKDLQTVGMTREDLQQFAATQHIEVELHPWNAKDPAATRIHEAAAEVPWEYLISAGTRGEGRYMPLLITRLFRNESEAVNPPPPSRVLFVESAPGRLQNNYDFMTERARLGAAMGVPMHIEATPTVSSLKKMVDSEAWDVVHVTGVDTHQAASLIENFYEELKERPAVWKRIAEQGDHIRDGMILQESGIPELPVPYDDLAEILVSSVKAPYLVTLNLYYSGARLARELVRRGAHAAIGFLDEVDDDVAELFFQAFFWEWCRKGGSDITHAFVKAWQSMAGDRLHGTAIAIWTGRSVFEEFRSPARLETPAEAAENRRAARLAQQALMPVHELLQVEFDDQPEEINYSLLHNERPLLSKLTLTKLVPDPIEDISVLVELNLGTHTYPYRCTHPVLDQPQLALAEAVKIPLTATLPRSLRERVQSTVYVKVTCAQRTAFETTKRVTLIPIDEWFDDTENNPWLPSFVVPRDPAVLKIISSARRYLIGIRDDPDAGFEGYQAINEDAADPSEDIDRQVQAIWTAIVNDFRLQYINPPPAYSDQTQRLRTPSDIVESNSGTCVDLALLLASCLEYIDIYPVIVLLTGHAFVGYWRSDATHEKFAAMKTIPDIVPAVGSPEARKAGVPLVDSYGWRLTRVFYDEIAQYIADNELVMLEATCLTGSNSFAQAREDGSANMEDPEEFDSMLDIRLARCARPAVTPLPILG